MELKRASVNGDDLTNPQPQDQFNSTEVCWCRPGPTSTNLMEVKWVQDLMTLFRSCIREEVEEAVKRVVLPHLPSLQISALPSTSRSSPHQAESSASRRLQLDFVGFLPDTLFTLTDIQDEGASLAVQLSDNSGSRVEDGPESFAKIKVVVLDGDFEVEDKDDCIEEDFYKNVVQQRKGKRPLLVGECAISMIKGVAVVSDIQFTDNSKWMRSGHFRLGVHVVKGLPPGVVIRSAVSKAFKVKERRLQSSRKYKNPSLGDYVWRLDNISKTGPICQRLAEEKVYTMKDFLQLYNTDAKKLQNILRVPEKRWLEIVRNAESCELPNECYRYCDDTAGIVLLLDCVFKIICATFDGENSQLYGMLDDSKKELVNKLRFTAYEKRSELQKIDVPTNQISVQAQFACPSSIAYTNMQSLDATSADHGELGLQVNIDSLNLLPYSYDGYRPGGHISQMQDHDINDNWISELLSCDESTPQIEERRGTLFKASTDESVTIKLKAACYVTKAAMRFMISIQQDHTAPMKKQKLR